MHWRKSFLELTLHASGALPIDRRVSGKQNIPFRGNSLATDYVESKQTKSGRLIRLYVPLREQGVILCMYMFVEFSTWDVHHYQPIHKPSHQGTPKSPVCYFSHPKTTFGYISESWWTQGLHYTHSRYKNIYLPFVYWANHTSNVMKCYSSFLLNTEHLM